MSSTSGANAALHNAASFTDSVTKQAGNKENPFHPKESAPKPASAAPTDYSHARTARASGGKEFMGIRSNEAPEINTALAARDQAKKALSQ
jgi:hypothetical protein